jgi:hypothetical protein
MDFTTEECKQWIINPTNNPRNGRKIDAGAKNGVYYKLLKQCQQLGLIKAAGPGSSVEAIAASAAIRTSAETKPIVPPLIPPKTKAPATPVATTAAATAATAASVKVETVGPTSNSNSIRNIINSINNIITTPAPRVSTTSASTTITTAASATATATATAAATASKSKTLSLPKLPKTTDTSIVRVPYVSSTAKEAKDFVKKIESMGTEPMNNPSLIDEEMDGIKITARNREEERIEEAETAAEVETDEIEKPYAGSVGETTDTTIEKNSDKPKAKRSYNKKKDRDAMIQDHDFSNSKKAKYYMYSGIDEDAKEPLMYMLVNSNWNGLVQELSQEVHLLESLIEHGISIIEVPANKTDFKDSVKLKSLEDSENPLHQFHYTHPSHQIPSLSRYINRTMDTSEAKMVVEFMSDLEDSLPDLGSYGEKNLKTLLERMEEKLEPIIENRKSWDKKYLEYYTDEDWFYIDFYRMVEELSTDDFKDLCLRTYKRRIPDSWLAEQYRDTDEIEEFIAHLEITIDELYGSEIAQEGSDEYKERLENIIHEFNRIKEG